MSHSHRQANYLDPFVDLEWVQANRDQVIIADARWYLDGSSGEAAYQSGHIPGAVFVDLDLWLSAPSGPAGLNPLPDPSVFAHGMGLLGIGDDSTVIAYDDAGGVIAARLVWMLRSIGKRAALLDGGLAAWQGTLETEAVLLRPVEFSVVPWPTSLVVSADVVDRWAGPVLDARNPDRFHGSLQVSSDPQPGHIPGAVNVPCRRNVDSNSRLLPVDQ
ncbi:sulfurtransferase [Glutamicibacter sp. NPDC087344]|uniref:sulfurtransferase n=1 Tax=Glutamicibacter sp. NPDC087344 TaxID=3363994 RepID=UPI003817D64A